jgi:hypothetical protein
MAEIQSIGPQKYSGVNVYYVPPPEGPNIFTAFWSGFLKTRLPMAEMVFAERLKQMRPKDYAEEIAKLEAERARYIGKMEELTVKARGQDTDLLEAWVAADSRRDVAQTEASSRAQVTRMELEQRDAERFDPTEKAYAAMTRLSKDIGGAVDMGPSAVYVLGSGVIQQIRDDPAMDPAKKSAAVSRLTEIVSAAVEDLPDEDPRREAASRVLGEAATLGTATEQPPSFRYAAGGLGAETRALRASQRESDVGTYGAGGGGYEKRAEGTSVRGPVATGESMAPPTTRAPSSGGGGGGGELAPYTPKGDVDDEYLREMGKTIDMLKSQHGKSAKVDFTAPIVTKPFASTFMAALEDPEFAAKVKRNLVGAVPMSSRDISKAAKAMPDNADIAGFAERVKGYEATEKVEKKKPPTKKHPDEVEDVPAQAKGAVWDDLLAEPQADLDVLARNYPNDPIIPEAAKAGRIDPADLDVLIRQYPNDPLLAEMKGKKKDEDEEE